MSRKLAPSFPSSEPRHLDPQLNAISHPGPTHGLRGGGKGRAAPPPPWFPPLDPPFRGAPTRTRNPQGGTPIPATPGNECLAALGAVVALGEDRATHGSGSPFGSRPLQIHPSIPVRPLKGAPNYSSVSP